MQVAVAKRKLNAILKVKSCTDFHQFTIRSPSAFSVSARLCHSLVSWHQCGIYLCHRVFNQSQCVVL